LPDIDGIDRAIMVRIPQERDHGLKPPDPLFRFDSSEAEQVMTTYFDANFEFASLCLNRTFLTWGAEFENGHNSYSLSAHMPHRCQVKHK
jgi:hypothetical protein